MAGDWTSGLGQALHVLASELERDIAGLAALSHGVASLGFVEPTTSMTPGRFDGPWSAWMGTSPSPALLVSAGHAETVEAVGRGCAGPDDG